MIYLAPLQGFTDFVYRKTYSTVFQNVDTFFVPYISLKNSQLPKKFIKEILPENNPDQKTIPQVLVKDVNELLSLAKILHEIGYEEINLNLGCPYPMVTKRGKGAGLLPYPEKIRTILSEFYEKEDIKLSVKLRAGLDSPEELDKIIPVLNEFPITEVILHPRTARQLYKGDINLTAYEQASKYLKHELVYNGDITNLSDLENRRQLFPETKNWMIGRGILMDPFLPAKINHVRYTKDEKLQKLMTFHQLVFEEYSKTLDNDGNILNKMKQFWSYFCHSFPTPGKTYKSIAKTKKLADFRMVTKNTFITYR